MISYILIIVLGILLLASYLDIKYRAVPSVLLTGLLLIVFIARPENLIFGIGAGLFAWAIKDILEGNDIEFGMADVKIIMIIGLLIPTMNWFLIFIGLFSLYQFIYTLLWTWRLGNDKERPFIPCLTAVFITLLMVGGVL